MATASRHARTDVAEQRFELISKTGFNSLQLLLEVAYGSRRFDDLARLADLTLLMAAIRLEQLVDAGLLAKQLYKVADFLT